MTPSASYLFPLCISLHGRNVYLGDALKNVLHLTGLNGTLFPLSSIDS